MIISPSSNNKSDFNPGDLIICSKLIPIDSDFASGISSDIAFLFTISFILSFFTKLEKS